MSAKIVTILESTVADDGSREVKATRLSEDDVQTLDGLTSFGLDSSAPAEVKGVSTETGATGESVLLGVFGTQNETSKGETRLYSTGEDGKEVAAFIMLRTDGTMELNGTGDFLTKFNEMESAFNTLKGDLDDLVTKYNAHIHTTTATVGPSAVPGVIAPTTSTGSPSTADMSAAKAENLKTE